MSGYAVANIYRAWINSAKCDKEQSRSRVMNEDIEMNTTAHQAAVRGTFDEETFVQDTQPPMIYGPRQPQRRQAWEFKRRHIEFMLLGTSPLEFHDLYRKGGLWVSGFF